MGIAKNLVKSLQMMERRLPLYLLSIFMMTALNALFEVAGSVFMKIIFDCANQGSVYERKSQIIITVIMGILAIIMASIFMCIYNNEAKRMSLKLKMLVFEKSMKFPYVYYEEHHSGEILSKLVYDTDIASNIYSSRLRRVLAPIIFVAVFAVAMMIINPFMTIVLIAFNVILFLINALLSNPMKKVGKKLSKNNAVMTNILSDMIAGAGISKIYDINHKGVLKYKTVNNQYTVEQKEKMRLAALLEMFNSGFDLFCALMFVVLGIILVQQKFATIGEVAAIYTLYTSLSFRFLQLGKNFPELVNCIAYAERIFEFLELPEENKEIISKSILVKPVTQKEDAVVFSNISFGYKDKEKLFNRATYEFPANKLIAAVGPSGCGKSTLAKLLLGFYTIDRGDILIFGKSISELGISKVREQIAYVPQEPYLYNVSILDNIRYARKTASKQEVMEAAKLANAHEFISKMENGYDTVIINRGNNLSGGERQRIAIARAILKDSPVILMDEATSALDNESEQMIADSIASLKKGKTVIMIAHRKKTIQMADSIVEV